MLAALPDARVAWSDLRLRGGWAAILAAALVALVFLPRALTNNDEFYYAGQARLLSQGRIHVQVGDPLMVPVETPEQAFRYPIAWPAVLAVGRIVSFRGLYVVSLLVHLLAGAAVARMLVRRGVSSMYAAAYLFHPVFWIYARTVMSDVPATAALLLAMDAWENRGTKVAAVGLGFTVGARLANTVAALGFGLAIVDQVRRRFADMAGLAVGVAAFWGVQMIVNHALGGFWLFSHYAKQNALMLDGHMALENGILYIVGLALLPPFSLLAVLVRPRQVDRWALAAATVVLAYLPISFHNTSPSLLETLVGGQRYVIPAHAALLIATAGIWSAAPVLRRPRVVLLAGVLAGAVASLAMMRLENRHGAVADAVNACHPKVVGFNRYANRVAGSVNAQSYRVTVEDRPTVRAGWDVLVLAPGVQTNQPGYASSWTPPPPHIPGGDCRLVSSYALYDFTGRCPAQGTPCEGTSLSRSDSEGRSTNQ